MRRRVGPDFPIMLRFSQWKMADYEAQLVRTPQELEHFLRPLQDAGVSAWDVSTRRFWLPAFEGSGLPLAAWAKKVTGLPTMTVGCVGLEGPRELKGPDAAKGAKLATENIEFVCRMLDDGAIDLVGIGRMLLANPAWADLVREGRFEELRPYHPAMLKALEPSTVTSFDDPRA